MPADAGLFERGRGKVLLFCWLGWVFDFYDLILFSFCKHDIGTELGLDVAGAVAWIEGWSLFATAVGGFVFGRFADRVGRRPAMVASIVVFSAGALLTGLASGFWSLLLARVVTGLGVGGEWGIGHAVVAEYWSGPQRDRVHGILQAGSPVAMALAAAVGCFLAPLPEVGWRAVFLVSSALAGLGLWARAAMPGPDRAVSAAQRRPAWLLFAPSYRRTSCVLLVVLMLHMAGFWCVYAELPGALVRLHRVSIRDVGWFQIQVNGVHVVADVMFGFLAARLGRIRMFVAFCLVFALGQWLVLQRLDTAAADFGAFTLAVAGDGHRRRHVVVLRGAVRAALSGPRCARRPRPRSMRWRARCSCRPSPRSAARSRRVRSRRRCGSGSLVRCCRQSSCCCCRTAAGSARPRSSGSMPRRCCARCP
jgi:MFS family permease